MRQCGDVFLAPDVVITGDVSLGSGTNLWYGVIIRGDIAPIQLGERVNLQDGVIVHVDFDVPLDIEAGVVAGHGAILHGRRIGTDVLVGIGAKLLGGSVIGAGSIIAAGTVVPERMDVPPRSLVMGVPGRVRRAVTDAELERTRSINARYRQLAERYVRGEVADLAARLRTSGLPLR